MKELNDEIVERKINQSEEKEKREREIKINEENMANLHAKVKVRFFGLDVDVKT